MGCGATEAEAGAVTGGVWESRAGGSSRRNGGEGRGSGAGTRAGKGQAAVQPPGRRARAGGRWARRARDLPGALRPPGLPPGHGGPSLPRATNLTAPEGDSADRPPCTGPRHQRRPRNPPAPSPARPRAACLARYPGSRATALSSPVGAPLPAPEPACKIPGTSTPNPRRRCRRPSYPGSRAPAAGRPGSEPCPSQPRPRRGDARPLPAPGRA